MDVQPTMIEIATHTRGARQLVTLACQTCQPALRAWNADLLNDAAVAAAVRSAVDHTHLEHGGRHVSRETSSPYGPRSAPARDADAR